MQLELLVKILGFSSVPQLFVLKLTIFSHVELTVCKCRRAAQLVVSGVTSVVSVRCELTSFEYRSIVAGLSTRSIPTELKHEYIRLTAPPPKIPLYTVA